MFYKFVHGYVATKLPAYFDKPLRYTRHIHPFSFRQIHTAASYYQYSFYPASVVLWNRLPSEVVLLEDLDLFRQDQPSVTLIKYTVLNLFYLHLFCTNAISFYQVSLSHFLSPTIFLLTLALTAQLHVILIMRVLQNG